MEYSQKGVTLTKSFEGLRLTAYQDVAGVWTIGYGHTGPDVVAGKVIDESAAEALLVRDLAVPAAFVTEILGAIVPTQGQFDALVDFAFNEGCASLRRSTLLSCFLAGNLSGAAQQFGIWIYAGGKPEPGLIRRRAAERELFLS